MNRKVYGSIGGVIFAVLASVFALEGGYTVDHAGETNHGITINVARENGYKGEMKDLTKEEAAKIYEQAYIYKPNYHKVLLLSPAVGHKLIDAGVNTGTNRSSKWFQESLNALSNNGKDYRQILIDGKIGNGTLQAYQGLVFKRGYIKACELTLKLMDAQQAEHYRSLKRYSQYTVGWVDHRIGNVPLTACKDKVDVNGE